MYHGSRTYLPINFQIKPQNEYTSNKESSELENLFESTKPDHLLSRKDSVFLCDNPDLIDPAGGYTDVIYEVETDNCEKSDLAWYTEAQIYLEKGALELAKKCSEKYWSGEPFYDDNMSCYEYRSKSATVKSILELNVLIEELDEIKSEKMLRVYHGTSLKNLESILEKGLISESRGANWYMVSDDIESALFHCSPNKDEDAIVLEFEIPIKPSFKGIFTHTPYLWNPQPMGNDNNWYGLYENIPSEFIKKVHRISHDVYMNQKSLGFKKHIVDDSTNKKNKFK